MLAYVFTALNLLTPRLGDTIELYRELLSMPRG